MDNRRQEAEGEEGDTSRCRDTHAGVLQFLSK